jgi:hypothetical protein
MKKAEDEETFDKMPDFSLARKFRPVCFVCSSGRGGL